MTQKTMAEVADAACNGKDLLEMRATANAIPVAEDVMRYAMKLCSATHPDSECASETAKKYVRLGASPRAGQALISAAKVKALMNGRYNVSYSDINELAYPVLRHRMKLTFEAIAERISPDEIVTMIIDELAGKKIVITAGPTYEKIDPVRFIGNYSSGKMGFALAEECAARGAEVTLVAGPVQMKTSHPAIHRIDVESCAEMYEATTTAFTEANAAILCAAVADFTPETTADTKIKREGDDLVLRLKPTHDIAAALGRMKQPHQRLVGFALETHDETAHAQDKLRRKQLDFIVLNSLRDSGAGFRHDTNKVTIISASHAEEYPLKSKAEVAKDIVDELVRRF
jgi:NAD(P)-dependent dehydrogenase (short-subunit alcohol dehydrogenase family)